MKQHSKTSVHAFGKVLGIVAAVVLSIVATCSFSACSQSGEDDTYNPIYSSSRTVMVYVVAENSLGSQNMPSDIKEMIAGMKNKGLHANDRLVVYVDDNSLPRIYVMDRNVDAAVLGDLQPVYTYDEDGNSSSPEQLAQFVQYVKQHYPADSYGLVMWSHASGWLPSSYAGDYPKASAKHRSFGLDNGKNSYSSTLNGHQMEIADMARVLTEQGGVDFILFDACFMQSVEVAYELRHATKYIISSPAEIPGPGADYSTMVDAMFRQEGYPEQMLTAYYNRYSSVNNSYGIVVSVVKTSALEHFAAYMASVFAEKKDAFLTADYGNVQNYFHYGEWGTAYPDFYDMQGVMRQVLNEAEYAAWKEEVEQVVSCMHHNYWYTAFGMGKFNVDDEQCCGMSLFMPLSKYSNLFRASYYSSEWGKDVWKE